MSPSQIQALDRTQPGLPMKKGRAGTRTHDYKRNTQSADNSTIRDRQTNFCGVLRSATQPSSIARSSGDSQMHACVFIPADSHLSDGPGILC